MYENMYNIGVKENADMVLGVPEYTYLNPSENQTYLQAQTCPTGWPPLEPERNPMHTGYSSPSRQESAVHR